VQSTKQIKYRSLAFPINLNKIRCNKCEPTQRNLSNQKEFVTKRRDALCLQLPSAQQRNHTVHASSIDREPPTNLARSRPSPTAIQARIPIGFISNKILQWIFSSIWKSSSVYLYPLQKNAEVAPHKATWFWRTTLPPETTGSHPKPCRHHRQRLKTPYNFPVSHKMHRLISIYLVQKLPSPSKI